MAEQKKLRRILEHLDKGWLKYEPKKENKNAVNWASYDEAQVYEIINFLNMVKNIIDEAWSYVPIEKKPGNQPKDLSDKAKAILLQQYFQTSNRVTAGLVRLFRKNLGVTESLTYKDIERAYDDTDVMLIISKAFELCNKPLKDKEKNFSIDGTGLPTTISQNYSRDKDSKIKRWEKAVVVIGNDFKMLASAEIAGAHDNESPFLISLLKEAAKNYSIDIFAADAAYLSRENCDAIASHGGIPRIHPKKNSVIKQRGSKAWGKMIREFARNFQKWLREYHIRSNVESGNSVLKRLFTRPLLKRLINRRKLEGFSRLCVYNIRRLNYIHYQHKDISIPWI